MPITQNGSETDRIDGFAYSDFDSTAVFEFLENLPSDYLRERYAAKCAERAKKVGFDGKMFLRLYKLYKKELRAISNFSNYPCTAESFLTIFESDEKFNGVKFNVLRGMPEIVSADGSKRLWTDSDDAVARVHIETVYNISNERKSTDAFRTFLQERQYNPLQEEIQSIKWDGISRCEAILSHWMGAEDTPYVREVSRLLFAGGIARAFEPGTKFDCVPVLIGRQGDGKSTFVNWLSLKDEFYSSVKTIHGTKGLEFIQGKWICELEELLSVIANNKAGTRTEDYAKAFLTGRVDHYRLPYDRRPNDYPRTCVFIGTTNRQEFLTDKTGNRRWYPIRMNGNAKRLFAHEQEVREDIRQCWAEAYFHYLKGDDFASLVTNDKILLESINEAQQDAECDDYREGLIAEYVSGKNSVCIIEIWRNVLHPNAIDVPDLTRAKSNELSEILVSKLHWRRGKAMRFPDYGVQKAFFPPENSLSDAENIEIL